jgi:hypothetical protein
MVPTDPSKDAIATSAIRAHRPLDGKAGSRTSSAPPIENGTNCRSEGPFCRLNTDASTAMTMKYTCTVLVRASADASSSRNCRLAGCPAHNTQRTSRYIGGGLVQDPGVYDAAP